MSPQSHNTNNWRAAVVPSLKCVPTSGGTKYKCKFEYASTIVCFCYSTSVKEKNTPTAIRLPVVLRFAFLILKLFTFYSTMIDQNAYFSINSCCCYVIFSLFAGPSDSLHSIYVNVDWYIVNKCTKTEEIRWLFVSIYFSNERRCISSDLFRDAMAWHHKASIEKKIIRRSKSTFPMLRLNENAEKHKSLSHWVTVIPPMLRPSP